MTFILLILLNVIMMDYTIGAGPEIEWTSKLNRALLRIYFLTPINNPLHYRWVKSEFDKYYPQYKDSITAEELYEHAEELIETIIERHDENELFPWTPELNREVIRIYYQAKPHLEDHEKKMKDAWNEKFPQLNAESNNLNLSNHAKTLFKDLRKQRKEGTTPFIWPSSMNEDVLKIDRDIPKDQPYRFREMKKLFDQRFPQLRDKVSVEALRQRISLLGKRKEKETGETSERHPRISWDHEKYAEVLHIFHHTFPNNRSHENRMQYSWALMHPELRNATSERLRRKALNLIEKNYQPKQKYMADAKRNFDRIFPHGFEYKDKEIMQEKDHPTMPPPEHQPEEEVNYFHPDANIYSPLNYQEFAHDFEMYHQMAGSDQWSHHVPHFEDYGSFPYQHGSSSQSHDQHHQK